MMNARGNGFLGVKQAVFGVAAVLLFGLPAAARAAITCSGVPGTAIVENFVIEPSEPRVGDDVTVSFDTSIAVYSLEAITLTGATPYFTGDTNAARSDVTFHLHAAQAGRALLQLAIRYGTEESCVDDQGGSPYFREGPTITSYSGQHEVIVAAAEASPTPTSTPTSAPTFTSTPVPSDGGGGCAAGGRGSLTPLGLLLAAAALRIRARGERR